MAQSPSAPALDGTGVTITLITKDNTNPFFVKMHEGAQAEAAKLGATLDYAAGTSSADVDTQIKAIEDAVSKGVQRHPHHRQRRCRRAGPQGRRGCGLLVIALDTPLNPPDAAQATFATDNFEAGTLIGQWAAGTLGDAAATAKIALIDDSPTHASVDVQRDQGFLKGFGVDVVDPTVIGDETDPRIVGHDTSSGQEAGGLTAMENLLSKDPGITVVHTINEPTAAGAYTALKNAGVQDKVLMVSVDGGCKGVEAVAGRPAGCHRDAVPAAHGLRWRRRHRASTRAPRPCRRCPRVSPSSTPACSSSPTSPSTACPPWTRRGASRIAGATSRRLMPGRGGPNRATPSFAICDDRPLDREEDQGDEPGVRGPDHGTTDAGTFSRRAR